MPLHELQTSDFVITTQVLREAKDSYTARKVQKDRRKARKWLTALLDDRDVIIHYTEDGQEKIVVGTRKGEEVNFEGIPEDIEVAADREFRVQNHIMFYETPSKTPKAIHIDTVTKFVCKAEGIIDVSNSVQWIDD